MKAITPSASDSPARNELSRGARAGRWERIARGIYIPADAPPADWDQIEAATRRSDATICLISALSHYELTDAIPRSLDVAIPSGSRRPATSGAITWHLFDRGTFQLGRAETSIPGTTQKIGLYSAERTIADAFRLRGALGYETARDALKEWLRRGGKPSKLIKIATQLPRAKAPILNALDMMT
ncbi:type IV toxin-antitoxin system AbiEi family antitoxin domain-containing protein [Microbacterium sp. HM-570]|jgi:predicted transcriptional regulator of viral defense system